MITLGIDSGTQSTKVLAFDTETGEILARAQVGYDFIPNLEPGHLEQHPSTWASAMEECLDEVAQALGDRAQEVSAIGISGQQHGLVVLDSDDKPVRAAKLWCDTSTAAECSQLHKALGGREAVIKLVGNAMLPGYTAPKILWLKKHEPNNYKATACILLPHDYLNFVLGGEKRMEYGDASGTALMDVQERKWAPPVLAAISDDLEAKLPGLGSSQRPLGLLLEDKRQKWGFAADCILSAGGGDNMMGAIGTGNVAPGVVTASLGTSGTIYAYSDKPIIDENGEFAAFCDSTDAWLPLVCTMNVTVATEALRKLFSWSLEELEAAVNSVEAGAEGVLFLPYLQGERTPDLAEGTGVFHGLTTRNWRPEVMARAVVEGVSLGLAYGLGLLKKQGVAPTEIRLTGGGSRSAVWRRIMAGTMGVPVVCTKEAEGAALGAAIQALHAQKNIEGKNVKFPALCEKLVQLDEASRIEPEAAHVDLYADRLKHFVGLTDKLSSSGYL
ncbi:MAG: xylulokinase [Verrucomicrobiales bacterium]